jgi:RNA polymerase sigma factor (sigma-70 family)
VSLSNVNTLFALQLSGKTISAEGSIRETSQTDVPLLTRRIAGGDEEAFREFHARYFDRLYQFLLVISRGRVHEAQEALQETLLRVARYAREFQTEDAFWCWLKRVARSAARDGGRKRSRYFAFLENFALRRPTAPQNGSDESLQLRSLLNETLDEMPLEDRRLIEGKYLDGAAVRELSESAGLTDKAVESRLLRARRQLRERLLKKLKEL